MDRQFRASVAALAMHSLGGVPAHAVSEFYHRHGAGDRRPAVVQASGRRSGLARLASGISRRLARRAGLQASSQ